MFSRLKTLAAEQAAAFTAEYAATAAAAEHQEDGLPSAASEAPCSSSSAAPAPAAGAADRVADTASGAEDEPSSTPPGGSAGSGWMGRLNVSGSGWINTSLSKVKTFIPDSVESFRTEHEVTAAQVPPTESGTARPPWEALTDEELPFAAEIKAACAELAASSLKDRDRREQVFMTAPPAAANFDFSLSMMMPTALACLAADNNLKQLRFGMVPRKLKEEVICPAAMLPLDHWPAA
jgi:hypothetical protein